MFSLKETYKNGFDIIVLADNSSNTTVEVIPGCGAMLHAFTAQEDDFLLNIIDSYTSKTEYDTAAESNGFKGLKLSPFPCRIQNATYRFNETRYRFNSNLFNGSVMHGFLYNKSFTVKEQSADEHSAVVAMSYTYTGDNEGYPFSYTCTVVYRLKKGNCLVVETQVANTGNTAMPVADGWHPYFSFHKKVDELELQFNATNMLEFVNLIPTGAVIADSTFLKPCLVGNRDIDNSFILDFTLSQPMCILRDPSSGWQLEIAPDQSYPYLQVYIPPHRNSIAIENLSAPPDAFNNTIGLVALEPGKTISFTTTYRLYKTTYTDKSIR